MGTARPTAWPTLTLDKFLARPLDALLARFRFFRRRYPTNPFVTGKRSNILPWGFNSRRWMNGFAQIRWYSMLSDQNLPTMLSNLETTPQSLGVKWVSLRGAKRTPNNRQSMFFCGSLAKYLGKKAYRLKIIGERTTRSKFRWRVQSNVVKTAES